MFLGSKPGATTDGMCRTWFGGLDIDESVQGDKCLLGRHVPTVPSLTMVDNAIVQVSEGGACMCCLASPSPVAI
jgi:hypothetical protein